MRTQEFSAKIEGVVNLNEKGNRFRINSNTLTIIHLR